MEDCLLTRLCLFLLMVVALATAGQGQEVVSEVGQLLKLGNASYNNGSYDAALDFYNRAIAEDPNSKEAWYSRGWALSKLNESNKSKEAFETALKINYSYEPAWRGKAYISRKLGDYFDAMDAYFRVLELNPSENSSKIVWYNVGTILEEAKRSSDAIIAYDKSIDINIVDKNKQSNYNKRAYYNKGNILYNQGDYSDAVVAYDGAIKSDLNYKNAYFNKGNSLLLQGNFAEAAKAYGKASEIDPMDMYAWNNRGVAERKLGRNGEALISFSKAIEIDPSYTDSLYSKGLILAQLGRYNDSLGFFEKVNKIDLKNKDAFYSKGLAFSNLRRYEEAVGAYDEAIKINKSYEPAWSGKGVALQAIGRETEALICFDRALNLNGSYNNLYWKGRILSKLGCHNEALAAYKQAKELELMSYANIGEQNQEISFYILFLLIYLILFLFIYNFMKDVRLAVAKAVLLLNVLGIIAFAWMLSNFLEISLLLKFLLMIVVIFIVTAIFLIIIDSHSGNHRLRISLALCEIECSDKSIARWAGPISYAFIAAYAVLVLLMCFNNSLALSNESVSNLLRGSLISILILDFGLTLTIAFLLMRSINLNRDTFNVLFISYLGYLGLNSLLAYWVFWSLGSLGGLKGELFESIKTSPLIIIIISVVIILALVPYLSGVRYVTSIREGMYKDQEVRLNEMVKALNSMHWDDGSSRIEQILDHNKSEMIYPYCLVLVGGVDPWQLNPILGLQRFVYKSDQMLLELKNLKGRKKHSEAIDRYLKDLNAQKESLASAIAYDKQSKYRPWASFANVFSLFLGPAISSIMMNTGLPLGSVDYANLASSAMLSVVI